MADAIHDFIQTLHNCFGSHRILNIYMRISLMSSLTPCQIYAYLILLHVRQQSIYNKHNYIVAIVMFDFILDHAFH